LLVDDEPFNLRGLKGIIELVMVKLGYPKELLESKIDLASNGYEAMKKVQNGFRNGSQYLVILTDCCMPVQDGYQFSQEVRDFYREHQ
jgi:YesN/AraC family two-component response regulator